MTLSREKSCWTDGTLRLWTWAIFGARSPLFFRTCFCFPERWSRTSGWAPTSLANVFLQRLAMSTSCPSSRRLPNGLSHEVNERGTTLSAGQRQLLAFARALAHDPQVLILDEATSSVDTETEIQIREAIDRLMAGRTSIVIAHRLSTIQKCDKILVMHKGRVRETGTHQQLLAQRGLYYKLYQLQYKDQEIAVSGD